MRKYQFIHRDLPLFPTGLKPWQKDTHAFIIKPCSVCQIDCCKPFSISFVPSQWTAWRSLFCCPLRPNPAVCSFYPSWSNQRRSHTGDPGWLLSALINKTTAAEQKPEQQNQGLKQQPHTLILLFTFLFINYVFMWWSNTKQQNYQFKRKWYMYSNIHTPGL